MVMGRGLWARAARWDLYRLTKSDATAVACVLGLGLAWAVVVATNATPGATDYDLLGRLTLPWNGVVAAAMVRWVIKGPVVRVRPPPTCAWCGYDLTGNVTGWCPECGEGTRGLRR